jgi:hypothetical protein
MAKVRPPLTTRPRALQRLLCHLLMAARLVAGAGGGDDGDFEPARAQRCPGSLTLTQAAAGARNVEGGRAGDVVRSLSGSQRSGSAAAVSTSRNTRRLRSTLGLGGRLVVHSDDSDDDAAAPRPRGGGAAAAGAGQPAEKVTAPVRAAAQLRQPSRAQPAAAWTRSSAAVGLGARLVVHDDSDDDAAAAAAQRNAPAATNGWTRRNGAKSGLAAWAASNARGAAGRAEAEEEAHADSEDGEEEAQEEQHAAVADDPALWGNDDDCWDQEDTRFARNKTQASGSEWGDTVYDSSRSWGAADDAGVGCDCLSISLLAERRVGSSSPSCHACQLNRKKWIPSCTHSS